MSTLIIQILCGNVLMGTLFVSLFALRQMLKLRRAIDAAFEEQVPESKPEGDKYTVGGGPKEICPGGGGGAGVYYTVGGAGGAAGTYVVRVPGTTVLEWEEVDNGHS